VEIPETVTRYSRSALAQSLLLHIGLVWMITAGIEFTPESVHRPPAARSLVKATVVDAAAAQREVEKLKAAEAAKRKQQQRKADAAERKTRELESKRQAEEKRIKELQAEKARLKKEQAAAKNKAAKAEAQERQRKADVAAREKAAAEQARALAAEQDRQREAAAKDAERKRVERALQDEIAAEDAARAAAAQDSADAREIDRYVAAIAERVRQSFTILPGHETLSCTLRITFIPGGEVAGVQVVKPSGNDTFDRQAENAVHKASPLPVPSDPRLFKQMRSILFVFDPQ